MIRPLTSIYFSSITADFTSTGELEVNTITSLGDNLSLGLPSERFIRRSQMTLEHHDNPAAELRAEEIWQQRMATHSELESTSQIEESEMDSRCDMGRDQEDSKEIIKAKGKKSMIYQLDFPINLTLTFHK